jgi:hypothetical protein
MPVCSANSDGLRGDSRLGPSRQNQHAALSACLLDRGAHEDFELLFLDNLYRLRHFDRGGEIQMFDRRFDRASRTRCAQGFDLALSPVCLLGSVTLL